MSEESSGEKSFAPSQKRKDDAAKKGDVLRSKEMATAASVLIGAAWLLLAGPWVMEGMANALRASFSWDRATLENFTPDAFLYNALTTALPPVLILGCGVILFSLVSQLGFGDGRWVGGNMMPKASRLNPLSGLKRMFGPNGWIEMVKGIGKVGLLGAIAWFWGSGKIDGLFGLGRGNLSAQLTYGWDALIGLLFALGGGLVVIGLIDFPIQWVRRMMRLKMSHQDMRDEAKEAEGSPEKKGAIRERQRKIAMGGLIPAMKEAQFVITNPTHFAVVLTYDPGKAPAPILLAKGRGDKALAIRELAAEYKVPVLEYPVLARSLFYTTRERQVIREELYIAVAAVLAFVLSLKRGETPPRPSVDVPTELRFDTDGRLAAALRN